MKAAVVPGLMLIAAIAASACNKEEPRAQPTQPKASAVVVPAAAPVAEVSIALESIPAEEEFEEEAAEEITAANLEQELDKLEKEMQNE